MTEKQVRTPIRRTFEDAMREHLETGEWSAPNHIGSPGSHTGHSGGTPLKNTENELDELRQKELELDRIEALLKQRELELLKPNRTKHKAFVTSLVRDGIIPPRLCDEITNFMCEVEEGQYVEFSEDREEKMIQQFKNILLKLPRSLATSDQRRS